MKKSEQIQYFFLIIGYFSHPFTDKLNLYFGIQPQVCPSNDTKIFEVPEWMPVVSGVSTRGDQGDTSPPPPLPTAW